MSSTQKTTLNLRYKLKPGARESMLRELRTILDLCAQEPEFITAILQDVPDEPDQLLLFEIWHGTREDFARVQGAKPYRKDFLARSKQHIESVAPIFAAPFQEWGTALLGL